MVCPYVCDTLGTSPWILLRGKMDTGTKTQRELYMFFKFFFKFIYCLTKQTSRVKIKIVMSQEL